jgi:hypothetical protein
MFVRFAVIFLVLFSQSSTSFARDTKLNPPINKALATTAAKEKLNTDIKFFFGEGHPETTEELGTYTANRKTNSFNKTDIEACKWVFLSSLLALQDRAIKEGGDAVIDIHSFYKKQPYFSTKKYECHAGAMIAGVALRGTVVKLK